MFGNVGLAERLSCSVFGSTVNEVARLEALTKKFQTPIVASEEFTSYCGGEWEALGREALRGVNAPMAVYRPVLPGREPAQARVIPPSRVRAFRGAGAGTLPRRDSPAAPAEGPPCTGRHGPDK